MKKKNLLIYALGLNLLFASMAVAQCGPGQGMSLSGNSGIIGNSTFWVPAGQTLTIDVNNSLSYGVIYMENDAKIVLDPGVTFELDNMVVQHCPGQTDLWEEIEIPNSTCSLIVNDSRFTSAKTAVRSVNGGYFEIDNTGFVQNRQHLNVSSYPSLPHNGSITNCNLTNYPANLIEAGQQPGAAIAINNIFDITIGDNAAGQNTINGGLYGVYSSGSSVDIENNYFDHFDDVGDIGVFSNGGQDIVVHNNVFNKMDMSVQQNNLTSSHIHDNTIYYGGDGGVYLRDCETSTIENNGVNNITNTAIEVRNMVDNYNIFINDNAIEDAETGIFAWCINTQTYPLIEIDNNIIEDVRIGIRGQDLKTLHTISNNQIFYEQTGNNWPTAGRGILLNYCWYSELSNNTITDISNSGTPSTNGVGILLMDAISTNTMNNKIIGSRLGVSYMNSFSDIQLQCNTVEDCQIGFMFTGGASASSNPFEVIGDGVPNSGVASGNRWVNCTLWRVRNASPIALEWWYSISGTDYDPTLSMSGLITPFTGPAPSCMPAPARYGMEEEIQTKVYPNPTAGNITVSTDLEDGKWQLFNLMGQIVYETPLKYGKNQFDLTHLNPGVYQSRIIRANNIQSSDKIIISR